MYVLLTRCQDDLGVRQWRVNLRNRFLCAVKLASAVKFLVSLDVSLPVDHSHPMKHSPRAYPTYSTYLSLVYLFSYSFPPFSVFRRQYLGADESQHGIGFLSSFAMPFPSPADVLRRNLQFLEAFLCNIPYLAMEDWR